MGFQGLLRDAGAGGDLRDRAQRRGPGDGEVGGHAGRVLPPAVPASPGRPARARRPIRAASRGCAPRLRRAAGRGKTPERLAGGEWQAPDGTPMNPPSPTLSSAPNPISIRSSAGGARPVKNPCTGLCRFDSGTGWCKGCGRSRADCRDWKRRPETRPGILRRLKDRMRALREAGRR
ncbi:DUF1289 domain-containing protein [Roseomonas mucosa]|uniref:DUF1289 domain-containing protein n=1 Tax=Roseomonas mucosa TaxID=207340 RepID=UPI0009DE78FA